MAEAIVKRNSSFWPGLKPTGISAQPVVRHEGTVFVVIINGVFLLWVEIVSE